MTAAKRVDLRLQNAITRGDKTREKLKEKAARQPAKKTHTKIRSYRDEASLPNHSNCHYFFVQIHQIKISCIS